MKVFIIGIAGGVGRRMAEQLAEAGEEPVGLVRRAEQAEALASRGIRTVLGDLVVMSVEELAAALRGCDAVVFSAGAGGRENDEATTRVDGDGPGKLAAAAERAGVRRFVLVSAFPEAWRDRRMDASFEHYMVEKKKAETRLVLTDLDWLIVRPSALTDTPGTGRIDLGLAKVHTEIARDDVAATIVELLRTPGPKRLILELTGGGVPIHEAVGSMAVDSATGARVSQGSHATGTERSVRQSHSSHRPLAVSPINEPLPAPDAAPSVLSRRGFLLNSSVLAAGMAAILPSLSSRTIAAAPTGPKNSPSTTSNRKRMNYITTKDGTEIYYKDWGSGPIVTFSHGWPLSSDAWESQMFHLASNGFRCIAHDRRGHGRSSQPWQGNDMDTYADDLAELFEALDVSDAMMVGHSTGGGEVARYIGRHGTGRVSKAVLMGSVTPIMLKTESNPGGLPMEVFDGFRSAYLADRAQFFLDVASGPFFGFNRPGAKVSEGMIRSWWTQGMMCGHKNGYDCIKAFSETDFTEDLKKFDVPTLIIHGEDDQIVPIDTTAKLAVKLVPDAKLKIYPGGSHGLGDTDREKLNTDLLEFARS